MGARCLARERRRRKKNKNKRDEVLINEDARPTCKKGVSGASLVKILMGQSCHRKNTPKLENHLHKSRNLAWSCHRLVSAVRVRSSSSALRKELQRATRYLRQLLPPGTRKTCQRREPHTAVTAAACVKKACRKSLRDRSHWHIVAQH